jgi:hypothetical protein
MNRNWRDLIGGIFLVPALHLGFILLILLMQSIFMSRALGLIFSVFLQSIGIAQFVYFRTYALTKQQNCGEFKAYLPFPAVSNDERTLKTVNCPV